MVVHVTVGCVRVDLNSFCLKVLLTSPAPVYTPTLHITHTILMHTHTQTLSGVYQTKLVLKWNETDKISVHPTKRFFPKDTSNKLIVFSKCYLIPVNLRNLM